MITIGEVAAIGRREADPHSVTALASTPRARYRAHTESSSKELAAKKACRVSHAEDFTGNGYLDASSNFDLGVILHMTYRELELEVHDKICAVSQQGYSCYWRPGSHSQ